MRVIVIGAGASGLAAAIASARMGAEVLLLEKSPKTGRKILASGNGRCNLMNTGSPRYFGDSALAEQLLKTFSGKTERFFEGIGLRLFEEGGGRVYPCCGQASVVRDALVRAAERAGVKIMTGFPAEEIRKEEREFCVLCGENSCFRADRVILCAGGMAGKNLGHNGDAYSLAEKLGHRVIQPFPALTGVCTDKKSVEGLSGMRCPADLTLTLSGRTADRARGEILFADYGVSGVCVMQLSRKIAEQPSAPAVIYADFSPMLGLKERCYDHPEPPYPSVGSGREAVSRLLEERKRRLSGEMLLAGLLPEALERKLREVPFSRLAELLSAYPLPVKGVRGFDQAQVTAGGLDTRQFDPITMESRLCRGMYACGEILNVDGDCGGFNLQFAFLSGLTAGENAAKDIR